MKNNISKFLFIFFVLTLNAGKSIDVFFDSTFPWDLDISQDYDLYLLSHDGTLQVTASRFWPKVKITNQYGQTSTLVCDFPKSQLLISNDNQFLVINCLTVIQIWHLKNQRVQHIECPFLVENISFKGGNLSVEGDGQILSYNL